MSLQTPYSSIDWIAEAERVRKAFGVEGQCEFRQYSTIDTQYCFYYQGDISPRIEINYDDNWCNFALRSTKDWSKAGVYLDWQGKVRFETKTNEYSTDLCRALFHLSLLTPEVETALGVAISHHQKMEWQLEYEGRIGG